ncbi:MAG: (2Fe-2S) ferredoxin domain-containing protein [Thermotogota bacterium]
MIEIYVCMGSACYLKGSRDIVDILNRMIKKYELKTRVKLKGSFCLGPCNQGVVIKVGDRYFKKMNTENTMKIFKEKIYPYILEIEESGYHE